MSVYVGFDPDNVITVAKKNICGAPLYYSNATKVLEQKQNSIARKFAWPVRADIMQQFVEYPNKPRKYELRDTNVFTTFQKMQIDMKNEI